jgi:hypothetical protein
MVDQWTACVRYYVATSCELRLSFGARRVACLIYTHVYFPRSGSRFEVHVSTDSHRCSGSRRGESEFHRAEGGEHRDEFTPDYGAEHEVAPLEDHYYLSYSQPGKRLTLTSTARCSKMCRLTAVVSTARSTSSRQQNFQANHWCLQPGVTRSPTWEGRLVTCYCLAVTMIEHVCAQCKPARPGTDAVYKTSKRP